LLVGRNVFQATFSLRLYDEPYPNNKPAAGVPPPDNIDRPRTQARDDGHPIERADVIEERLYVVLDLPFGRGPGAPALLLSLGALDNLGDQDRLQIAFHSDSVTLMNADAGLSGCIFNFPVSSSQL
jgi:hypothetical protein